MRRLTRVLALADVIAGIACGSSTTAPSTTVAALHAEVNDPAGDATTDARVPIPPDLIHATVDVGGGNVTFLVQLAPGTLDRQATRVAVLLDTDRNLATGIQQANGLGADYGLDLVAGGQATITKADPVGCAAHLSCFNAVGSVSLTLLADSMQVVVPLSMLGATDGRMCFQFHSYVLVSVLNPVTFDFMPDVMPACIQ